MYKVSVIIPVYNSEKYLKMCIDSILTQTLKDIEVILVDDGSTDSSLSIMENYSKKDDRVRIITQKNSYAGIARNNGLKKAVGEYVVFWDSDDYFAEDALEKMYLLSKKNEADICVGEAVNVNAETGEIDLHVHYLHKDKIPEIQPFNIENNPKYIFNFANNSPWNKMYRRAFLDEEHIEFQDTKGVDDVFFVMSAFACAKKIITIDDIIVYYQLRLTNLSARSWDNRKYMYNAYMEVRRFLERKKLWENEDVRQSYINKTYSAISSQFSFVTDYETYQKLVDYYTSVFSDFGIGIESVDLMYAERHRRELFQMLSVKFSDYIYDQYMFYRDKNVSYHNQYLKTLQKVRELRSKKESLSNSLKQSREKNKELKKKISNYKERILKCRDKISNYKNEIQRKNKIIKKQQGYLSLKMVKVALKLYGINIKDGIKEEE